MGNHCGRVEAKKLANLGLTLGGGSSGPRLSFPRAFLLGVSFLGAFAWGIIFTAAPLFIMPAARGFVPHFTTRIARGWGALLAARAFTMAF